MATQRASAGPYVPKPVQQLLADTIAAAPDRVAIIDGDRRFTYGELGAGSSKLAAALAGLGVQPGDRVGILSPNCIEFEVAFFGILKAGAIVTTINSGYREHEIAHQLRVSGAGILIVHHELAAVAELARVDAPSLQRMIAIEDGAAPPDSFWGLIAAADPSDAPQVPVDPGNDLAVLPFSSGTTGLTKGVMLTHTNLVANVQQYQTRPGEESVITGDDVVLVHLPLFHIYGMVVLQLNSIEAGATQVMMGRFDMPEFLRLIETHRVSKLFTAPPVALALSQSPLVADHDVSSLRAMFCGAAPLSEELQQRVARRLGCPVAQGYGLTETSPVTNSDFTDERCRPGTVGPPVPDTEERVVDVETGARTLGPGELGELLVRGPQVMAGYYDEPEATAAAIDPDGWFHTGDIVTMDEDGFVRVMDRKKELIKYKGFQVPPAELEGLLLSHPAVADTAVIPKPDDEAGEVPKAFVVLRDGASATAAELMAFVADEVATFKQVREVEFIDAIPKNASGKLLRRMLVERERAGSN